MARMKAAVFDGRGGIAIREVSRPELSGDYDVQCRLVWGTTCTGTDMHIWRGCFPYGSGYPTIAGHESAGRVEAIGAKVRHFKPGDLVTRVGTPAVDGLQSTWGGYAEWGVAKDHWAMAADGLPEAEWSGSRVNQLVPGGIDPRAAPMFTTWREILSYMRRMNPRGVGRFLVLGGGGNGLAFAAMARLLGASAVAMSGAPASEAAARKVGVDIFADYHAEDLADRLKDAGPFDGIVDSVGRTGQLDRVLRLAAPDARLGIYGGDDLGKTPVNPSLAPGGFSFYPGAYNESETHQTVCDWIRQGRLRPDAWYDMDSPWALADLEEAFSALRARRSAKALIRLE